MKTVAIVQSSYIPWKGYFDLLNGAEEPVLLDDVQYTRRDWRNRNRIKTPQGPIWLTIPVEVKGKYNQTIRETRIADPRWARRHLDSLRHSYARAPHFAELAPVLDRAYEEAGTAALLSDVNAGFIRTICGLLGIETAISSSADFELAEDATERLVSICLQARADRYLSGPSARSYLDEARFERAGVEVAYVDYSCYPVYPQLYPPFVHEVTVLDLLAHTGPEARRFMKSL